MPAATLASLPAELHGRIASMCAVQDERYKHAGFVILSPTFPLSGRKLAQGRTTVSALSVVSRYWNQVTEPYRFSRLKAADLASCRFRFGFGHKFGRYITELDLTEFSDSGSETDPTFVLDAVPSLPNLHTTVTPVMSDVVRAVIRGVEYDNGTLLDRRQTQPEVSFVVDRFHELFASVPSLVMPALSGDTEEDFFDRLATFAPQTRQLVLCEHEEAEPPAISMIDVALVAIQSLPLLAEFKLVMIADFVDNDYDAVRRFVVPPACHLQHLVLSTYAEFAAPLAERFGQDHDNDKSFLDGVDHFPRLETLIVTTGDPEELRDIAASLSPTTFPVLRRLELRARYPANLPAEMLATITEEVVAAFASRPLPPLTVVADSVSTDFRRLQFDASPLPAVDQPGHHRRSLAPSIFLRDPFSRGYPWLTAQDQDLARDSRHALEPLLDRVREMIHEAVELVDCVQLRRVAHALQPCELLRIERNA